MKNFKEILKAAAQKGKFIDKSKADRKLEVLDEIDEVVGGSIGDKLKGMKSVEVMAPDQESLEAGIEKAGEIVEEMPEDEEESEMSEEEILAKIEELKSMLENKSEEDMEDSEEME